MDQRGVKRKVYQASEQQQRESSSVSLRRRLNVPQDGKSFVPTLRFGTFLPPASPGSRSPGKQHRLPVQRKLQPLRLLANKQLAAVFLRASKCARAADLADDWGDAPELSDVPDAHPAVGITVQQPLQLACEPADEASGVALADKPSAAAATGPAVLGPQLHAPTAAASSVAQPAASLPLDSSSGNLSQQASQSVGASASTLSHAEQGAAPQQASFTFGGVGGTTDAAAVAATATGGSALGHSISAPAFGGTSGSALGNSNPPAAFSFGNRAVGQAAATQPAAPFAFGQPHTAEVPAQAGVFGQLPAAQVCWCRMLHGCGSDMCL